MFSINEGLEKTTSFVPSWLCISFYGLMKENKTFFHTKTLQFNTKT